MLSNEQVKTITDENLQVESFESGESDMYLELSFDIDTDSYFMYIEFVEIRGTINIGSFVQYVEEEKVPLEINQVMKSAIEKMKQMIENSSSYRLRFVTGELQFEDSWGTFAKEKSLF